VESGKKEEGSGVGRRGRRGEVAGVLLVSISRKIEVI
jgi:hypothetical protein